MKPGATVEGGTPYTPEWDFGRVLDRTGDMVRVRWALAKCVYWEDVYDLTETDGRRKTECDSPAAPLCIQCKAIGYHKLDCGQRLATETHA
jgi:hypothetical protein